MDDIHFRLAKDNEEDGAAFCNLYNFLYARKVNFSYYRWQFFQPPFSSYLSAAVNSSDGPVGFLGVHFLPASSGNVLISRVLDAMIHPDYQHRGIFRCLADYAMTHVAGANVVASTGILNATGKLPISHVLAWRTITVLEGYVAPTNRTVFPQDRLEFVRVDQPEPGQSKLFGVRRDRAYLDWRFNSSPQYSYDHFQILKRNEPFGYVVLKIFEDPTSGEKYGDIMDFNWTQEDQDSITETFHFALRYFVQRKVSQALLFLQTNSFMNRAATGAGFQPTHQTRTFCGRILNPDFQFLENGEKWFLTLADCEQY
jgi:hypothetical protein